MNLAVQEWLKVKPETRMKLKEIFNIPKSSFTIVSDNKVQSDGHTYEDLGVVTVERLQQYTGVDSADLGLLWTETVKLAEKPTVALDLSSIQVFSVPTVGKGLEPQVGEGDDSEVPLLPFCGSCDSKGVRHKKECPKKPF